MKNTTTTEIANAISRALHTMWNKREANQKIASFAWLLNDLAMERDADNEFGAGTDKKAKRDIALLQSLADKLESTLDKKNDAGASHHHNGRN